MVGFVWLVVRAGTIGLWLAVATGCGAADFSTGEQSSQSAGTDASTGTATTSSSTATTANGNVVTASGSANAADGNTAASSGNVTTSKSLPTGVLALPMTGCTQYDYFTAVVLGGKAFSLLLDSGSATAALAASTCTSCSPADLYNVQSGTPTGVNANSTYADGTAWSGSVYADVMALGTVAKPVTAKVASKFVAITQSRGFFEQGSCASSNDLVSDGILGLAPNSLLRPGTTSFFSGLVGSKTLAADIFSFQHCNVGGTLWLGGYDTSVPTGAPVYTDMLTNGTNANYYTMGVNAMALGGTDLGLSASSIGPMVVDNGTGGLLLKQAPYEAVVASLSSNAAFLQNFNSNFFEAGICSPSKQGYTPTQLDQVLPKLSFGLPQHSGGTSSIQLTANGSYLYALSADNEVFYCPAVYETATGVPPLFGNVAMREHVVIFDRAAGRIGFAPHNSCPATVAVGQ